MITPKREESVFREFAWPGQGHSEEGKHQRRHSAAQSSKQAQHNSQSQARDGNTEQHKPRGRGEVLDADSEITPLTLLVKTYGGMTETWSRHTGKGAGTGKHIAKRDRGGNRKKKEWCAR